MHNTLSSETEKQGLIFDIQKFSVHDGPGIRNLVFMKGCPLRCPWCSNPESQNYYPEVGFNERRCIGCDQCEICLEVCSTNAIKKTETGNIAIDKSLCTNCGECAEACPAKAIILFGKYISSEEIIRIAEEDSGFFSRSGGGVTVSGGEPAWQADFVYELLKKCRMRGMDTAIETCGYASWENLEKISKFSNLIFFDIKHINSSEHKAVIGVGNELILENICHLSSSYPETPIIVRTPVIPGFNDTIEAIKSIKNFLKNLNSLREYELLPYHRFGEAKYEYLKRQYLLKDINPPTTEHMAILGNIIHA